MLPQIGLPEALLFLLVVVVLFGANRVRGLGGALGGAIRDFRSAMTGADEEPGQVENQVVKEAVKEA